VGRSPHASIKVLPATPREGAFSSSGRMVRAGSTPSSANNSAPGSATAGLGEGFGFWGNAIVGGGGDKNGSAVGTSPDAAGSGPGRFNEAAIAVGAPNGLLFAKRKKSPWKGPVLNSSIFGNSSSSASGASLGSPAVGISRLGASNSDGRVLNLGLRDLARRARGGENGQGGKGSTGRRKSQIIEEEEEDENVVGEAVLAEEDEDEEVIEEVDEFSDVEDGLKRGESVHSIVMWDDPPQLALGAAPGTEMGNGLNLK
jgi:hypothetical protein